MIDPLMKSIKKQNPFQAALLRVLLHNVTIPSPHSFSMPGFTTFNDNIYSGTISNFVRQELEMRPKEYSGRVVLYNVYPR
jgi:hypothetical protein